MSVAPPISQRLEALEKANQTRCARAAFKQNVAVMTGPESAYAAARLLVKPPDWARTWPVGQLLQCVRTSQRRVRRSTVLEWLVRVGLTGLAPLGEVSERQRRALAGVLVRHAGGLGGGNV